MDPGGGFIRSVELDRRGVDFGSYPYSATAVRHLRRLELDPSVTFLVGENGSGKSTLIEAIAVTAGFNPEGGSRNFRFASRESHSELHERLSLVRGARTPRTGFFLRAESFYNVASQVDELLTGSPLLDAYGGQSLHQRSHGESFIALATYRFGPNGLYFMDEPESALSLQGSLALLRRMHELVRDGSQFVVATHSPILLAFPNSTIYALDEEGFHSTVYEETEQFQLTRSFLEDRKRFFRHLFSD